jgi:hypothetical protein
MMSRRTLEKLGYRKNRLFVIRSPIIPARITKPLLIRATFSATPAGWVTTIHRNAAYENKDSVVRAFRQLLHDVSELYVFHNAYS